MDQQHTKPAANNAAFSPATSGSSSSSRSIHGSNSMSSAFLGMSSSTHSQRRPSPSRYPRPAPAPLPGDLASRGSAASGGSASASGSSLSQSNQISPSPGGVPSRRRPRPNIQRTHSLPTPFLSELRSIRRMGANIFGELNAQEMTLSRPLLHGQQEQEMTHQSSSLLSMSHHHTPIPSGEISSLRGLAPLPLQQQQAQPSFSSLQPLPGGNFSAGFPFPALQPQQMQPSSSTDLPSRIFSGFETPAASKPFSTNLASLPSSTTIFQSSSSCPADHAQPSSDSELPPLPPSLEIPQYDLPPLGHLSQNNGSSTESSTGFVEPSSNSEMMYEPVVAAPSLEPETISLDDDGDELSALVHSFASSRGHGSASFATNLQDRHSLQLGGSAVEGGGQTSEAMPTPATVQDTVNNGDSSSRSIPWNNDSSISMPMYSQSEEQELQQLTDLLHVWSSTTVSSRSDQSMGSTVAGSCQGLADMPALANKFDMMSFGDSSRSGAGPEMPWNYSSLSVQNSTPVHAMPKLMLGGMDRPGLPPRPSSMSPRGAMEPFFSEDDMERISKDNRLRELVKTDPKLVKRIVRNRASAARLKVRNDNHIQDLQRRADALKMECNSLSAQVQSQQEMIVNLKTESRQVQIKLDGLKEQANLSQALNHQLQSELQRLKLLELNMMCTNGVHHP